MERESHWEEHLQLLLYVYRTTKHSSTGFSPFEVLFGLNPPLRQIPNLDGPLLPEPSEYCEQLRNKLALLREMVDSNLVESASQQQNYYNGSIRTPLKQVLLSNPCAGKLQPRWTGPWLVKETRGPSTVTLTMGDSERTVHINRIRLLLTEDTDSTEVKADWTPPLFHHYETTENNSSGDHIPAEDHTPGGDVAPQEIPQPSVLVHHRQDNNGPHPAITTRSGRTVKPVQRYGHTN